jgi:hypothetical protein
MQIVFPSLPAMGFNDEMNARAWLILGLVLAAAGKASAGADVTLPDPKPVPRAQAIPLPHHQVSLQRDGIELARFSFDRLTFVRSSFR